MLKNFEELIGRQQNQVVKRIALVNPVDEASLKVLFDSRVIDRVKGVLIGNQSLIETQIKTLGFALNKVEIINTPEHEAAKRAVQLAEKGTVDVLMKGHLGTRDFLKPVIDKESGIAKDSVLTHVVVNELEGYPKLLITTDGGMVPEPHFTQKIKIIENALKVSYKLGYVKPKIAVLAAAEVVNPKIQSSIEAKELALYFDTIKKFPCEIDGPLSLDLALSSKVAELKEYESRVAGEADILIGPDMTAMNLVGKSFTVFGKGKMAGIICGAKVPIVMTSRASSSEEKYFSLVLASIVSDELFRK